MFPNLNAELARRGMKKKEFAKLLDISERTAANKLCGKSEFTLSEIRKISGLFPGLSVDYLLSSSAVIL